MGYKELITGQLEAVYQKGIANKILQFMQKIRNEYDEGQARRWAMELLQNGRDVAYEENKLKAKFELYEDKLIYSHNGKSFRVKDILSIIYQVSSKLPGEESIGRFGTGFMSTHQLCERVQLEGILKDADEAYCPFQVMLDRSGTEAAEVLEKIESSVQQIYGAVEVLPEEQFDKEAYNTKFTYYLETKQNKQAAKIGMEDMKENVLYVMLFSDKIKEITLLQHTEEGESEVSYMRGEDVLEQNDIRCLKILETDKITGETREHRMLYLLRNGVTIAAEMNGENCILPISPKTSRLFIDFPLIGSEEFPFPMVVNSSKRLQPNEPRSGIALSDNVNSKDSVQNKEVMQEAVAMHGELFRYAVKKGLQGLEHLVSIAAWKENKEQSEHWVHSHIYQKLYEQISAVAFLETNEGRRPLLEGNVYLISKITTEEGQGIRELVLQLKGYCVPMDNVDWPRVLAGYGMTSGKILSLPTLLERAESILKYTLDETKMEPATWCQKLYNLAMQNEEQALLVRSGRVKIYPNQNAEDWKSRRLYTCMEIKADDGIPEVMKDVSEQLDRLNSAENNPLWIRKTLLHKEFQAKSEVAVYERSSLFEYIRRRSNRAFPVVNYSYFRLTFESAWLKAWELLLSCGEDEELYKLYEKTVSHELRPYQREEKLPSDICWNAYKNICKKILEYVQNCKTLEQVSKCLYPAETKEPVYVWLNLLFKKAIGCLSENEVGEYTVFPNQEGVLVNRFVNNTGLFGSKILKQDGTNTEELKEILKVFADERRECNLYAELLDKNIRLENSTLLVLKDEEVAAKLNNVVQQILSEKNISDVPAEYQDACTRLLAYIQDAPELAKKYFPGFCSEEEQMRLLTPKAAVRNQKRAKEMQSLLEELGVENFEEAKKCLKAMKARIKSSEDSEEDEEKNIGFWYGDGDVWCDDPYLDDLSDMERERYLRMIGLSGEKYAFEEICRKFSGWEEEERTGHRAVFCSEEQGLRATVEYPDTDTYKQNGWDIRIAFDGSEQKCYYVEVKTHSITSKVRRLMSLSPMQMIMAMQQRQQYTVMMVSYSNAEKRCIEEKSYQDPVDLISKGVLKGTVDKYNFSV